MPSFSLLERLETVAGVLVSETFLWSYVGLVVLAALYLYFQRFWWKLRRIQNAITAASQTLMAAESPRDFHDRFEEISQKLGDDPILGVLWSRYLRNLFPKPDGGKQAVIGASKAPGDVFTWDTLLEGRIDYRLYDEIPNYLVGIGILGTFIGLTGGMILASGELSGSEEQLRSAVSNLIRGASLAFLSSVVGLLTSIVFSVTTKRNLNAYRAQLDDFVKLIGKRVQFITAERVATEQLSESQKQTAQLQQFNTDLAVNISAALDDKLSQRFAPTLEKMIGVLEQVRDERSEGMERMLKDIAENFRETMTGAAGSEMSALSETLEGLTAAVQETTQKLSGASSEAGSGLVEASRQAAEEIRRVATEMAKNLEAERRSADESADQFFKRMQDQVEKMSTAMNETASGAGQELLGAARGVGTTMMDAANRVGEGLLAGAGELEGQMKAFGSSVSQLEHSMGAANDLADGAHAAFSELKGTVDTITQASSAIRSAALPVAEVAQALTRHLQEQQKAMQQIEELIIQLGVSSETAESVSAKQTEAWSDISDRFGTLDSALAETFKELVAGIDAYSEKIREFVVSLDRSLSQATGLLSGAVKELRDTVEELGDATSQE